MAEIPMALLEACRRKLRLLLIVANFYTLLKTDKALFLKGLV